ncbi:hypothetical protein PHYBLDRAFT_68154 [Phycomyces blakesleeanus NRRL 1555(-)]|uniref:Uncharacterized protein n=1 Tax=Phycomyces blakesleeanus (strain ATCC 8743b / DSM 1359 / FGSC 10004 / NBRC 33097 / NRRL 1555) TaxID=763407 RepID=A0A162PY06_PHYB8|nr:hypothetical protein PHYBLDRAFT_68154 [Phycomyces blakesleeanus NRRL 1555(-)]OAD77037.1 hypothetical protein PHYBLDRAFT_68154 [Phycomyces blakesleeanus NRRL 1555(-)]|eukprot:XP_018295077.1 hypothetical protein PHYBLDRAFT_68154 [Phycomyces blakesleeanus NRRL 1555(-)]
MIIWCGKYTLFLKNNSICLRSYELLDLGPISLADLKILICSEFETVLVQIHIDNNENDKDLDKSSFAQSSLIFELEKIMQVFFLKKMTSMTFTCLVCSSKLEIKEETKYMPISTATLHVDGMSLKIKEHHTFEFGKGSSSNGQPRNMH